MRMNWEEIKGIWRENQQKNEKTLDEMLCVHKENWHKYKQNRLSCMNCDGYRKTCAGYIPKGSLVKT